MNTQIPLYRAKKIGSDEYVIGFLIKIHEKYFLTTNLWEYIEPLTKSKLIDGCKTEIDPSTLSIHFPDMLANDSDRLLPNGEKDLRIFASLNDDGKGGDMAIHSDYDVNEYTFIFNKTLFEFGIKLTYTNEQDGECWKYSPLSDESLELFEIIGVQK